MARFTLYSRSYCHLCDDMLATLRSMADSDEFVVDVIDIDTDAELVAKYDELVPVLVGHQNGHESKELCHYFLDPVAVEAFINAV